MGQPSSKRGPYKFNRSRQAEYFKLLRQGRTRTSAAAGAGVTRQTVALLRKSDETFARLELEAEADRDGKVETALYDTAVDGNVAAQQVWLYNRRPEDWKDQRAVRLDGQVTLAALVSASMGDGLKAAEVEGVRDAEAQAIEQGQQATGGEQQAEGQKHGQAADQALLGAPAQATPLDAEDDRGRAGESLESSKGTPP